MLRWLLLFSAALAVWALDAPTVLAQQGDWPVYPLPTNPTQFPRGPGFYLSTWKILSAWVLFAVWVKITDWLSQDCLLQKLNYPLWNSVAFFPFLALFIFQWLMPFKSWWFYVDYFFLIAAIVAPLTTYIIQRNKQVDNDKRVMTREHLRFVIATNLNKLGFKIALEKKSQHDIGPAVKIIPQGAADDQANNVNLLTARQSEGFLFTRELIYDALQNRADGVMLDYGSVQASVRYQVDGVWQSADSQERIQADPLLAVMKQVANLKPAERRARQAGTFGIEALGQKYNCRIASQGTETGERVLLQFDNRKLVYQSLEQIGMRQKMEEQLLSLVGNQKGFVVVSAMPGGGLTTTTDAFLNSTDRFMRNYAAVEDVAKRERDILNVPVTTYDAAAGEGPETVLPKLIRTYPDVLVVRDPVNLDTLKLLCEQAGTERMVISTARAKEAVEALLRVLVLKIPPAEFAKVATAVLNVRLVRKLCEKCKESYPPSAEVLKQMGLPPGRIEALYRPRTIPPVRDKKHEPCEECKDIGYKGRTAICELLVVDDALRQALATQPKLDVLRAVARKSKHRTLQDEGLLLVAKGVTSIPELLRVLKVEEALDPKHMYLTLLLLVIFFACMALLFNAGLWSNAITLVNVITAGLLATNFFEPVANWFQSMEPSYTFFCDFLALWGVFALSLIVLRTVTDTLSKVKVRFKKPVDLTGSIFLASWIGWVMICFTLMSLHTAPLARSFLRGEFQAQPMDRMFMGLAPDRKWLGLFRKMSVGTLSRGNPQANMFDPQGEFILKYGERRAQFEKQLTSRVNAK